MKNNTQKKGLLDHISMLAGCTYMSDLHCYPFCYNLSILEAVNRMKKSGYSLREWTDAVCYITGNVHDFESVEEAVGFLGRYLKG